MGRIRIAAIAAVAALCAGLAAAPAAAAAAAAQPVIWRSSAQYGTFSADGYTWSTDFWDMPPGAHQSMWVAGPGSWGTVTTDDNGDAYPDIGWAGGRPLSSYHLVGTESDSEPPGSGGRWDAAYDIWLNNGNPGANNGYEVMVWTNDHNWNIGNPIKVVTIDGVRYGFYQREGGSGPGSWLVRMPGSTHTVTNLSDVISFVVGYGGNYSGPADPVVDTVEYGWEISTVTNGQFTITSFSLGT